MSEHVPRSRRHRRLVAPVVAGVLALTGAGLVGAGLLDEDPAPPAPVSSGTQDATPSAGAQGGRPARDTRGGSQGSKRSTDVVLGTTLPRSAPVRVHIPRLDVSSRLVRLGLQSEDVMEVPSDPSLAGWFTGSPEPGTLGPSVIAGHVTWNKDPAVFYRLGDLRRGDKVTVDRADGSTATFRVTGVDQYDKNAFPTDDVYGSVDHAGLRLITCGGTYDDVSHRYLDNVVVYARLVA